MQDWLHACNGNFGATPRELALWDRLTYLRVPKPLWLRLNPFDELRTLFRNLDTLFRDGIVVWGWVIQANCLLFDEGNDNCPGEILYSLDELNSVEHMNLEQLQHELADLKGTKPDDPELRQIAEYLTEETIRVFGLPVPSSISSKVRCRISTTLFIRKHLPKRVLWAPFLPVLVNRREPYVVMPLPERYWPDELVKWW